VRVLLALCFALAGLGCATRAIVRSDTTTVTSFVVAEAPPEAPAEASALAAPGPVEGRTWVQGHWVYLGQQYRWAPGRWIPTLPGLAFRQPRWARRDGGWGYVPGAWLDERGEIVARTLEPVTGSTAPSLPTSGGVDASGPVVVTPVQPAVVVVAPASPVVREEAHVPPPPAADAPVRLEPGAMAMAGPQRGPDLPPVPRTAPPLPPPVLSRGSIFGGVGSGIFHGAPIGVIPGYRGAHPPRLPVAPRVTAPPIVPVAPRVPPIVGPHLAPHVGPLRPPRPRTP
jgi:hypothetical protein